MAFRDSLRYPHFQEMLSCYWLPGGVDEPLMELTERIKADAMPGEVETIRREIADFLRSANDDLDAAFDAEFVSYYWPRGDGLTARAWLTQLDACLAAPPEPGGDRRSGAY